MKIGFFGTPVLALECLKELNKRHDVLFAVTQEDKPAGRRQRVMFPPVKEFSLESSIPVYQPAKLRDGDFISELKKYEADIYVVVAYGKLIPSEVYNLPPLKTINLHPSLLPKYRGAAPVQWAIINGEKETGITVQLINDRLDAGDIVVQEKISIAENTTADDLNRIVAETGPLILDRAIGILSSGRSGLTVQDEDGATHCGKIDRETARIDWRLPAKRIHDLVRGLNPKPGAWTLFREKVVKIWMTRLPVDLELDLGPGMTSRVDKKRLITGTGDGIIEILELQPETKSAMDSLSFINGYRIFPGEMFSSK